MKCILYCQNNQPTFQWNYQVSKVIINHKASISKKGVNIFFYFYWLSCNRSVKFHYQKIHITCCVIYHYEKSIYNKRICQHVQQSKKKPWSNCWSMITKRHSWQTWNLKLKLQLNLRLRPPLESDYLSWATSLLKYQKFASQITGTIYICNLLQATTSHKRPWPLL